MHNCNCRPGMGAVLCVRSQHLGGTQALGADKPSWKVWTQGGQGCSLEHHHPERAWAGESERRMEIGN